MSAAREGNNVLERWKPMLREHGRLLGVALGSVSLALCGLVVLVRRRKTRRGGSRRGSSQADEKLALEDLRVVQPSARDGSHRHGAASPVVHELELSIGPQQLLDDLHAMRITPKIDQDGIPVLVLSRLDRLGQPIGDELVLAGAQSVRMSFDLLLRMQAQQRREQETNEATSTDDDHVRANATSSSSSSSSMVPRRDMSPLLLTPERPSPPLVSLPRPAREERKNPFNIAPSHSSSSSSSSSAVAAVAAMADAKRHSQRQSLSFPPMAARKDACEELALYSELYGIDPLFLTQHVDVIASFFRRARGILAAKTLSFRETAKRVRNSSADAVFTGNSLSGSAKQLATLRLAPRVTAKALAATNTGAAVVPGMLSDVRVLPKSAYRFAAKWNHKTVFFSSDSARGAMQVLLDTPLPVRSSTDAGRAIVTFSDLFDALLSKDGSWPASAVYLRGLLVPQVLTRSMEPVTARDLEIGVSMGLTRIRAICQRAGWECTVSGDKVTITYGKKDALSSDGAESGAFEACESPIALRGNHDVSVSTPEWSRRKRSQRNTPALRLSLVSFSLFQPPFTNKYSVDCVHYDVGAGVFVDQTGTGVASCANKTIRIACLKENQVSEWHRWLDHDWAGHKLYLFFRYLLRGWNFSTLERKFIVLSLVTYLNPNGTGSSAWTHEDVRKELRRELYEMLFEVQTMPEQPPSQQDHKSEQPAQRTLFIIHDPCWDALAKLKAAVIDGFDDSFPSGLDPRAVGMSASSLGDTRFLTPDASPMHGSVNSMASQMSVGQSGAQDSAVTGRDWWNFSWAPLIDSAWFGGAPSETPFRALSDSRVDSNASVSQSSMFLSHDTPTAASIRLSKSLLQQQQQQQQQQTDDKDLVNDMSDSPDFFVQPALSDSSPDTSHADSPFASFA